MNKNKIKSVDKGSPAERAGIRPGQALVSINGHQINDLLDYRYHACEREVKLVLDCGGAVREAMIVKDEYEDIGLEFESAMMNDAQACRNKCVFCFIDQLPKGMRDTLYFKDDDLRLSFLQGNYITLTNLSDQDIERIIKLRISPVNISVHTTDPLLRVKMMGYPRAAKCHELLKKLAGNGITMNTQIVVCPGINDGATLESTLEHLSALFPRVISTSVVPVGLTGHRDGLYPLIPVDSHSAGAIIDIADAFGDRMAARHGLRAVYAADELYIKAGRLLPSYEYYDDFPQFENGVGIMRLFIDDFMDALGRGRPDMLNKSALLVTGTAAYPFIKSLIDEYQKKCDNKRIRVLAVENRFFGGHVDVAGLITGGDIVRAVKQDGGRYDLLLFPGSMLRRGGDLFLDDMIPGELSEACGFQAIPVPCEGNALYTALNNLLL